jgi:hypothetical protein
MSASKDPRTARNHDEKKKREPDSGESERFSTEELETLARSSPIARRCQ